MFCGIAANGLGIMDIGCLGNGLYFVRQNLLKKRSVELVYLGMQYVAPTTTTVHRKLLCTPTVLFAPVLIVHKEKSLWCFPSEAKYHTQSYINLKD